MKRRIALVAMLMLLGGTRLWGAGPAISDKSTGDKTSEPSPVKAVEAAAKEDPAHAELRTLRDGLVAAIKKNDVDEVLTYLDPDVVVTWQNGEVSRKPAGVRAYYDRVMKGPNRIVDSYTTTPAVDELTRLLGNGDTGISFGSSVDHYKLTDGSEFDLPTRWSATVVKSDGKWRIASFHASVNMFDNPVLMMTVKRVGLWVALGAGVVGILVGLLGAMIFRRPSGNASRTKTAS